MTDEKVTTEVTGDVTEHAAADNAISRYAWETAATHLTLALDHLDIDATVERVELLTRLADALRTAGNESLARQRFADAVECACQLPDPTVHRSVVIRWTNVPVDIRTELERSPPNVEGPLARLRGGFG